MNEKSHDQYRKILLEIIDSYLPQCTVILFGSRAQKRHKEGADIDIALDAGKPIEPTVLFNIKNAIDESFLPVFVDIVDLQRADETIKEQVNKYGVIWKN